MLKRLVVVLLLTVCCSLPVSAWDLHCFKIKPNDQVVVTLLSMVISDLEMCRASLRPQLHHYGDNVLAIGHLRNAQSALSRTDLDYSYRPLIEEIHNRLGKIKFYLVMNDLDNVAMRCSQLVAVLRSLIASASYGTVTYPGQISQGGGDSVQQTPTQTGTIVVSDFPVQQTPAKPVIIFNNPVTSQPIVVQQPIFIVPTFPSFPSFPGFSWGGGQNISVNLPGLPVVPQ